MIDLKTLDIHKLPCVNIENKNLLPEISSVYFVIDSNNMIQYIGRAQNIKQRWLSHHRYNQLSKIGGLRIVYLQIEDIDLLRDIETILIGYYKPPLNNTNVDRDGKKTVTVILNENIYKDLKDIATVEARSLTSLVTYVLIKYIEDYRNKR